MHRLRRDATAEDRRLLRFLLLRIGTLPANPGGCNGFIPLLSVLVMSNDTIPRSRDWLSSQRTNTLAWWIPKTIIVASLSIPVSTRAVLWVIALVWMGTACILNSRRCGRSHCRYTGPYYLV